MYHTYILYSPTLDRYYRGSTQDLPERIRRHNASMESATAPGAPWTLLWTTAKPDRSTAQKLEFQLKNLSHERLLRFILKYDEGIPDAQRPIVEQLYADQAESSLDRPE